MEGAGLLLFLEEFRFHSYAYSGIPIYTTFSVGFTLAVMSFILVMSSIVFPYGLSAKDTDPGFLDRLFVWRSSNVGMIATSHRRGGSMMPRFVSLLAIWLTSAILLIATPSLGNPSVPSINPPDDGFLLLVNPSAVAVLALINFSTDLLWFSSLLLLAGYFFGQDIGRVNRDTRSFGALVLLGAFIICIAGAIIDVYLLMDTVEDPYTASIRYYVLTENLMSWAISSILICASVYAVSVLMLKIDFLYALVPSVGIGVLNLCWWLLCMQYHLSIVQITVIVSIILCPIVLILLSLWHRKTFSTNDIERPVNMSE